VRAHRPATMPLARRCPKCGNPMLPVRIEDVTVDVCSGCQGIWFDPGELTRAAGIECSEAAGGVEMMAALQTDRRCAACGTMLLEREFSAGSGTRVDQCPQCRGIYLDRGEMARLQAHFGVKRPSSRPARPPADVNVDVDPDGGIAILQYLAGLPIEVDVPQTIFPPAVMVILLANLVVLVAAYVQSLHEWVDTLGVVPVAVLAGDRLWTLLTAMFMHSGALHFLGNAWFLYITGDNVEERLGSVVFLGFYLVCGVVAGAAHVVARAESMMPAVGASGAVSGILGAYVVLFPRHRFLVRWLVGIGLAVRPVSFEIPAWAYLGFWFLLQLLYASLDLPGVGWWAHVGGFACGVCAGLVVRALWREDRGQAPVGRG
jgi:membrane associated rhomboid family serine protease